MAFLTKGVASSLADRDVDVGVDEISCCCKMCRREETGDDGTKPCVTEPRLAAARTRMLVKNSFIVVRLERGRMRVAFCFLTFASKRF